MSLNRWLNQRWCLDATWPISVYAAVKFSFCEIKYGSWVHVILLYVDDDVGASLMMVVMRSCCDSCCYDSCCAFRPCCCCCCCCLFLAKSQQSVRVNGGIFADVHEETAKISDNTRGQLLCVLKLLLKQLVHHSSIHVGSPFNFVGRHLVSVEHALAFCQGHWWNVVPFHMRGQNDDGCDKSQEFDECVHLFFAEGGGIRVGCLHSAVVSAG